MSKLHAILILLPLSLLLNICNAQYISLVNFNGINNPKGASPCSSLILSGKTLFGMTKNGGAIDSGCIFSVDTNGNNYKDIFDFISSNGATPYGSLTLVGKKLFGMTNSGGANYDGRIFSIDTSGANYKNLMDFTGVATGKWPVGSLTYSMGRLYGMNNEGGANNKGTIFGIDTDGTGFKDIFDCNGSNGQWPWGDVVLSGNTLFGMFTNGGAYGDGDLFSIDTNGTGFRDLLDFDGNVCGVPQGSLILSGKTLFGMTEFGGTPGDGNVFSIDTSGTGFKNLLTFSGSNGNSPAGTLSISGNTLFGMTQKGGAHDSGCIFSLDTSGTQYIRLFDFSGPNGDRPYLGHVTISGSTLYGITNKGGTNHNGLVFKFLNNPEGINNLSTLKANITIYPNPSNGTFEIKSETLTDMSKIEVYNILGVEIYFAGLSTFHSQFSIDLSNQPAGIYFYSLIDKAGEVIENGKLILQR